MSKLRLLFVKEGTAAYISHLDLLRTVQRAFPRTELEIKHSQGFHPHPIISIVLPLPVAQSSDCELLDFEVTQDTDGSGIAEKLNEGLPEGLRVLGRILPALVVLLSAVQMFRASGAMELLTGLLSPVLEGLGIPPETVVLLCTALSGGSLQGRLEEACAAYGAQRLALDLERLMMDFPLPCPSGEGIRLSREELAIRMQGRSVFYAEDLCARYFTYRRGGQTHFVLFDDAGTLRRKIEMGQALGIREGFVMLPEVEDLTGFLFTGEG